VILGTDGIAIIATLHKLAAFLSPRRNSRPAAKATMYKPAQLA
jgi:hypothetical protein